MYHSIEITKDIDEFNREKYIYSLLDYKLLLDNYYIESRKTKRSKFKVVKSYSRLNQRDSKIRQDEVILSDELKQEALDTLLNHFKEKIEVSL